jgi:hypothetical protein
MIVIQINDLDCGFNDYNLSGIKRKLYELDYYDLPIYEKISSINNNYLNNIYYDDIKSYLNNIMTNDIFINNVWSFCGIRLKKEFLKKIIKLDENLQNNDNTLTNLYGEKISEINDLYVDFKNIITYVENYFNMFGYTDLTKSNLINSQTNLSKVKSKFKLIFSNYIMYVETNAENKIIYITIKHNMNCLVHIKLCEEKFSYHIINHKNNIYFNDSNVEFVIYPEKSKFKVIKNNFIDNFCFKIYLILKDKCYDFTKFKNGFIYILNDYYTNQIICEKNTTSFINNSGLIDNTNLINHKQTLSIDSLINAFNVCTLNQCDDDTTIVENIDKIIMNLNNCFI